MIIKDQNKRLKETNRRLSISKEKYKNYLRTFPLSEIQAEIIKELNKQPSGERSIYIESGKSIRKDLKTLMDAGYVERGKDKKYFLNEDGYKKLRWAEIGIAKTSRNLQKKTKKDRKDTLKKWKEELPKLKKKKEEKDKKLLAMYNSVSPETKKAYRNNKHLWEDHSRWIETKDEKGLRTMKVAEAYQRKLIKTSNKMYRMKNAIKRVEKELKGISTKRVYKELPIERDWRLQQRRKTETSMERIHKRWERESKAKKHVVSDIDKYNAQRSKNLNKKMMDLKDLYDNVKHPDSKTRVMNEIKKIKNKLKFK